MNYSWFSKVTAEFIVIVTQKIGEKRYYGEGNETRYKGKVCQRIKSFYAYAGISTKFLYEIENNHKGMSAHTLLNICKALDVSCDYIMTGGGDYTCDQEVITIIESFDASQIPNVKKILTELLELSKY